MEVLLLQDRIVSSLLDRAWGHFELYEQRRTSLTVLRVSVECNARDLRAFDRELAAKMADIVTRLDALERDPRQAWREVYELKRKLGELRDRRHKLDRPPLGLVQEDPELVVAEATLSAAPETPGDAELQAAEAEVDALEESDPIVSPQELKEVLADGGEGRKRDL